MRIQAKISLPIAFVITIFLANCSVNTENNTYLTPIPWSTLSAYQDKRPITNKLDAVIAATSNLGALNLNFTQGIPKVTSAEEMKRTDAWVHIGQPNKSGDGPGDAQVWLVVFEGSWQDIAPGGDVLPEETGCIYVILDAQKHEHTFLNARKCVPQQ